MLPTCGLWLPLLRFSFCYCFFSLSNNLFKLGHQKVLQGVFVKRGWNQHRLRTVLVVFVTIVVVWILKLKIFVSAESPETISIILTAASILFGLLASYFINELWTRFSAIRDLQSERTAAALNMIQYAKIFYKNKAFEKEFKERVEATSIADMAITMNEGHLEVPYFVHIEESFRKIRLRTELEEGYFERMATAHQDYVRTVQKLDLLYKHTLFFSEWLILLVLSALICVSVLFLPATDFFSFFVVLAFPAILILALNIIYDLNNLTWHRDYLTLEPTQVVFDALEVKRFYMKSDIQYVHPRVKDFRTEDSLEGNAKQVYDAILAARKKEQEQ
jgi:ABC-type multidrug transport system fused ATPase/permease subunit